MHWTWWLKGAYRICEICSGQPQQTAQPRESWDIGYDTGEGWLCWVDCKQSFTGKVQPLDLDFGPYNFFTLLGNCSDNFKYGSLDSLDWLGTFSWAPLDHFAGILLEVSPWMHLMVWLRQLKFPILYYKGPQHHRFLLNIILGKLWKDLVSSFD